MQNIITATTTTLIEKEAQNGDVGKIRIMNNHSAESQVSVWITDDTDDYYYIKNLVIPTAAGFVIDGVYFDADVYSLKIQTHSGTTDIMVQLRYTE
jgi:hypothetical protein